MMIKTLLKKIMVVVIFTITVSSVMIFIGWSLIKTNTITIDITRYALEGNTTVISSFYMLAYPGTHKIYVHIHSDSPTIKAYVKIFILTKNGPIEVLRTNPGKNSFSSDFKTTSKMIYGFVVSRLEVPGTMNNPYSRAIILVKIR